MPAHLPDLRDTGRVLILTGTVTKKIEERSKTEHINSLPFCWQSRRFALSSFRWGQPSFFVDFLPAVINSSNSLALRWWLFGFEVGLALMGH